MARKRPKPAAPRFIAIEGPIGVGKTTLARYLAKQLGARTVLEDVDDNPFLAQFYADPKRFAFQTQMFFLLSRYQQQLGLHQEDLFQKTTICDYIFQRDRIFAYLTLSEAELSLYERIYRLLDPRVPTPDLVVYLQARPDVIAERIRLRARLFERTVRQSYIDDLVRAYNDFFFHYKTTPLLVVNTSEIDLAEKESHLEGVLTQIMRMSKGTQFFSPAD
ncbi:MAG: deoxynucleoside kinase [Deltaproteobacteria bacterium]|nr:deoxynucleoside kinase [Deltaproteobacteria bacterium]